MTNLVGSQERINLKSFFSSEEGVYQTEFTMNTQKRIAKKIVKSNKKTKTVSKEIDESFQEESGKESAGGPIEKESSEPCSGPIEKESSEPCSGPIERESSETCSGPIERESERESAEPGGRPGTAKRLAPGFEPFISHHYHHHLHNIPPHLANDLEYMHFHIFSIWFLSKININVPHDLEAQFKNVHNFPFFSTLFHIRNNIAHSTQRDTR
jgi:hypothetical protein